MKTLLQINVTANWGSTGKIAEQIGLLAMENGWESYIAYGRMMNPSKSKLIKIGSQWDVYLHYFMSRFFDMEGLMSRRATKLLIREIERIKPDVIHLHNIHDHYLNYSILFDYLTKTNVPIVWTQHDQWATTGHCCFYLVGCEKWKTGCEHCPESKWYSLDRSRRNYELKKVLLAKIPRLTIVPVSEWLGREMAQSHLKDRPIRVIHNGIDINVFKPQELDVHRRYGIEGKKIVLGVAAVWDERKGLKDFLKLSEMLPQGGYAIVIVGKVNTNLTNDTNMLFVERTQNALELAQLYSAAAVFVNPTYNDNYPTTNLEAMACGTPVITYNTGGSPEAVDEKTGRVVEQGDVKELREAIIELSNGDYSERCRRRAEHLFDNKTCFSPYIKLYNQMLGGG